jgi:uncharacterized protein (TIGR00299 family) protein
LVGTKVNVVMEGEVGAAGHGGGGGGGGHGRDHDHDHDHDHAHDHDHDHDHVHVHVHEHEHEHEHEQGQGQGRGQGQGQGQGQGGGHRHYREIREMLETCLTDGVRARAMAIFERIAVVEARLHGVSVDEVAFHEVGAVDSIVDIVGAAAALAWLAPARITARRVPLGGGSVMTAHGRLPVPAPATLELLAGAEVEAGGDTELTTPTGAAILAASASSYGPMPAMRVVAVGWGAGDRDLGDRPNLLRVVAGVRSELADAASDEIAVVEANIDDMNPELCEPLLEAVFAAGAVDAWFTSIVMKKSRPALTVAALCPPAARDAVAAAILRESTTIGVRFSTRQRTILPRHLVEVDTPWGRVPVKVAGDGDSANAAPEYEACRRLALSAGIPVKRVYLAALAAFFRR